MSLDLNLLCKCCGSSVFSKNMTHNLTKMASKADLYNVCWHPEDIGIKTAEQAIPILESGLAALHEAPSVFRALNPENGWGSYEGLVEFVEEYLEACKKYPQCNISTWT